MSSTERKSNYELLRIVSMFFIGVSMFMLLYYHAEKMKYPII